MNSLLLALALDSAEAAESAPISCDTVVQHEVSDQSCATQTALSKKLKEAFPGKEVVIQDLGDKGMQGNRFLVDIKEGPFVTVKFSERDGSCRYATGETYPPVWYPSLENLRDEKTTDFHPETHGIDLSAIWDAEEALGVYTTDSTEEDTAYTKTYKDFHLMVTFLRVSVKVGQERGWGDAVSTSGIQRVSNLGCKGLSREEIRKNILESKEFKALPPEAQLVFTDYVENKGAVITALGQMEPIMRKCAGNPVNAPLPFYQ